MAIEQLSEHVYYLPGGVNAAILVNEKEAVLVDTGGDKNYGRELKRACESLAVTPVAIINTHSHADHYGGNEYLLKHYDVPVYAPEFEASIIQSPLLEPVYLFGGARPLPELMNKWLLAKPSKVDHFLAQGKLELIGLNLDLLDTSGHAHRHFSLLVDDVLIAADALFGSSVIDKYPLPFGQDIGAQIASAQKLKDVKVTTTLPGHGNPSRQLLDLIDLNLAAFERASNAIFTAAQGLSSEEILQESCRILAIELNDLPRYFLNLCVVNAYLNYLRTEGKLSLELKNNRLLWAQIAS
ncbi:MAG: MBL fold metallo-hydrolase [Trueperaceae bacterium]|nr:MBL fold metallo-hydrolase [Trueperaceae bacterium]